MSGARAIPAFSLFLLLGMILSGIATVSSGPPQEEQTSPAPSEIPIGGGTVTLPDDFEAGERFLQFVEPPTFTRTEEALENPDLQPGDLGDQGGEEPLVLERRVTDYSYVDEESIGDVIIDGVTGTPERYLCVCDATFIFDVPNILTLNDSRHIWFDNVTLYGGLIDVLFSQHVIISNSKFIDAGGVRVNGSEDGLVHNITVVRQRGPLNIFHSSDVLEEVVGEGPECWPHHERPCARGGVVFWGSASSDWTVEWSHLHNGGVGFVFSDILDIKIQHNTFRNSIVRFNHGDNEVAWNLFRGQDPSSAIGSVASDYVSIHNNSILFPFKLNNPPVVTVQASPGISLSWCDFCDLSHNDFLGYGIPHPDRGRYPALCADRANFVVANDNYWGTLHDPRIPNEHWICTSDDTELVLERWETEPIHDITPIMYTLDHRDIPYWAEQITGLPVQDAWDDLSLPDG